MKTHWTAHSTKDFAFRIALDFIAQLDKKMESTTLSQGALAKKLKVSKGRVSQVFNDPGNIELETIVKFSKALNMKVAIVAYEDDDPKNTKGPVDPEIFKICWEKAGKPRDFWAFQEVIETSRQISLSPAIADCRLYMASMKVQGTPTDIRVVRDFLPQKLTHTQSQASAVDF